MGRYRVMQPYTAFSGGRRFGPWQVGEKLELDAIDAEWVNRDSPGTLESADEPKRPPGKTAR